MADKVSVELGGRSKYEVAEHMAREILYNLEGKSKATREEYLQAVYISIRALNGLDPPKETNKLW
ncbi:hypothetical protein NLM33_46975 (plasmid) [Bradyrhizobium sp. CCGUVB1N3]|uniref:hypothetical protein n=1 Tax=Bradyrhizobium sp. CCGUVB1N3 TaxID=2949629 RepID=UPI0020B253C5|nr:hypothetical protein [Bradyrhizobium sp. CCGUVB1N3]MCP3477688.1 hypothetical protein [Bradyrhizobium sp. CCGUVB1N3]